jgi:hypothetical protein
MPIIAAHVDDAAVVDNNVTDIFGGVGWGRINKIPRDCQTAIRSDEDVV